RTRDNAQTLATGLTERVAAFDAELTEARTSARILCESLRRNLVEDMLPAIPADEADRTGSLSSWRECCDAYVAAANEALLAKSKALAETGKKLEALATTVGISITATEPAALEAEFEQAVTAAHGIIVAAQKDAETLKNRIDERKQMEDTIDD